MCFMLHCCLYNYCDHLLTVFTFLLKNFIINKKSNGEYDGETQTEIDLNIPFVGVLTNSGQFAIVESFHRIPKKKLKHCIIRSN